MGSDVPRLDGSSHGVLDHVHLDTIPPLTAILNLGHARTGWSGELSTRLAARRDKADEGLEAPGYGVPDLTAWHAPERLPRLKEADRQPYPP